MTLKVCHITVDMRHMTYKQFRPDLTNCARLDWISKFCKFVFKNFTSLTKRQRTETSFQSCFYFAAVTDVVTATSISEVTRIDGRMKKSIKGVVNDPLGKPKTKSISFQLILKVRPDERTTLVKHSAHFWPCSWVGRVDQLSECKN